MIYKFAIEGLPESDRIVIRNGKTSPNAMASFSFGLCEEWGGLHLVIHFG